MWGHVCNVEKRAIKFSRSTISMYFGGSDCECQKCNPCIIDTHSRTCDMKFKINENYVWEIMEKLVLKLLPLKYKHRTVHLCVYM